MIGTVEDSKKILDRIMKSKSAFYKDKKTASDLLDEIEIILDENNPINLIPRLKATILEYKNLDFNSFQKTLKELKLYQKITMHPLSHGINGMPTFTIREIEKSIVLLKKMEDFLKAFVNSNVVAV